MCLACLMIFSFCFHLLLFSVCYCVRVVIIFFLFSFFLNRIRMASSSSLFIYSFIANAYFNYSCDLQSLKIVCRLHTAPAHHRYNIDADSVLIENCHHGRVKSWKIFQKVFKTTRRL